MTGQAEIGGGLEGGNDTGKPSVPSSVTRAPIATDWAVFALGQKESRNSKEG